MLVHYLELRFDEGEGGELKNYETWFGFALAMRPTLIDRSDVQMCPSMLVSWIALYMVCPFLQFPWSKVSSCVYGGSSKKDRPKKLIRYWTIHHSI